MGVIFRMGRTRLFKKNTDITSALNIPSTDRIYIYEDSLEDKRRTFTWKSLRNTNYTDIDKLDYAIGMMDFMSEIELLKRELISSRTREKFFIKKLVESGVSTAFSPQEISEFEVTITDAITGKIDAMLDDRLTDVDIYIANKVSNVIAKSKYEWSQSPEYDIIRISNQLHLIDLQLKDLSKSQIAKDKKAKATKDLQEVSLKLMARRDELVNKYKPKEDALKTMANKYADDTKNDDSYDIDYSLYGG